MNNSAVLAKQIESKRIVVTDGRDSWDAWKGTALARLSTEKEKAKEKAEEWMFQYRRF